MSNVQPAARVAEALLDLDLDLDLDTPAAVLALVLATCSALSRMKRDRRLAQAGIESARSLVSDLAETVDKIGPEATSALLTKAFPLGLARGQSAGHLEMLKLSYERGLDHTIVVAVTGNSKYPVDVSSGSALLANMMGKGKTA